MSSRVKIETALKSVVDDRLRGVHVGMPGRIESYDMKTQRATIQPLIERGYVDDYGERQTEVLPPITNVPIVFSSCGSFSLTFPLSRGDLVWLSFSDFSLDEWLKTGSLVSPRDDRNHSLGDAVAFPGVKQTDQVDANSTVIFGDLKLGDKDADDPVALKSDLEALKAAIDDAAPASGSSDGGTAFKADLLEKLSSWPTCSQKVKAK